MPADQMLPPSDILAMVQLFGEVVKPVREDVRALSGQIDSLRTDIENSYYNKDAVNAMRDATRAETARLKEQQNEMATAIEAIKKAMSVQWETWLLRAGMAASLLVNILALIKIFG